MKVVVVADIDMQKEFESKGTPEGIELHFETSLSDTLSTADAFFYLLDEEKVPESFNLIRQIDVPVFVNAVIATLENLPRNATRINAWPGFIERPIVEICTSEKNASETSKVLEALNWKYEAVPDISGMVAPRIISTIINEAWFALGDDVSGKEDIDTAMKLGTNYPFGPFEWGKIIGLNRVYNLLSSLSKTDKRYLPAPMLAKEILL